MRRLVPTLIIAVAAGLTTPTADPRAGGAETPPSGVKLLLPRGAIPAVFDPVFVPATRADVPDDAWVLGIFMDGVARAYSLNLLNEHEVVNDRFGDRPIAAVW